MSTSTPHPDEWHSRRNLSNESATRQVVVA